MIAVDAMPEAPDRAIHHDFARHDELAGRIQRGERQAFAELVGLFQKKVFVQAYGFFRDREDALEIVQETFMRIYEKIGAFKPEQSLSGWIYRVTHNLCVDHYRKTVKKRRLASPLDTVPEGRLASADDDHPACEAGQLAAAIDRALDSLSGRQRQVFVLKYRQGMKLCQVADAMAVSLGTVKALHHRALKRIRREVAPGPGGEYESMS